VHSSDLLVRVLETPDVTVVRERAELDNFRLI
jgi:hypothetical protein